MSVSRDVMLGSRLASLASLSLFGYILPVFAAAAAYFCH